MEGILSRGDTSDAPRSRPDGGPPDATRAELRDLASLARRRERRDRGLCLVEGATLLEEALRAGLVPALVVAEDGLDEASRRVIARATAAGASLRRTDARQAARASAREHAAGLLAAVPLPPSLTPALQAGEAPCAGRGPALVALLCGLQDPGNVGTLLRSARAFGAAAALLDDGCADPFGPKALRASAGACFGLPSGALATDAALARAADWGLAPVAAVPPAAGRGLAPDELPERVLLLLGHETRGVPAGGWRPANVDQGPEVESLNVAAAGAVLMAGWFRSWRA